jgi:hypothetical protein
MLNHTLEASIFRPFHRFDLPLIDSSSTSKTVSPITNRLLQKTVLEQWCHKMSVEIAWLKLDHGWQHGRLTTVIIVPLTRQVQPNKNFL